MVSARPLIVLVIIILAVASLLVDPPPSVANPAADIPPPGAPLPGAPQPPISKPPATSSISKPPATSSTLEAWRQLMLRTRAPNAGCYVSSYPSTQLKEVPCTTAPASPNPLAMGGPSPVIAETGGDRTEHLFAATQHEPLPDCAAGAGTTSCC
jgi:hypothetical protein